MNKEKQAGRKEKTRERRKGGTCCESSRQLTRSSDMPTGRSRSHRPAGA